MSPLPELISNLEWLFSNPVDLKNLRGDIWAWGSVPHTRQALRELLLLLERHKVAATFFMSGVCAEQNKDEVSRIRDAGHELGLHGYRHVPYDMPWAEMLNDMHHAISVFTELGVPIKGFRAPWLVASKDAYRAAQKLNLEYVSNVSSRRNMQRLEEYNLVELPIYLNDQALLQENGVDLLLKSSKPGRVFEFHLLYVRQRMKVMDEFLNRLKLKTSTLSQIAEGSNGVGLSFDVAYLDRRELLRKLLF